jgi:acyl dehydratase
MKALDYFQARLGKELGVSQWRTVSQNDIERFAEITGDDQFIHVDAERARESTFGTTIAHGFLTLSLLTTMAKEAIKPIEGRTLGINYGFDKVRFLAPVRSGARVRGRFSLDDVEQRADGGLRLRYNVNVEIEGETKVALSAQWLSLSFFSEPVSEASPRS